MECLCSFAVEPSPSLTCRAGTRRALSKLAFCLSRLFSFFVRIVVIRKIFLPQLWFGKVSDVIFLLVYAFMIVGCARYHYHFFFA